MCVLVTDSMFVDILHYRDSQSDTSSISQYSYDPSRPSFHGKDAEIPSNSVEDVTESSSSIQLITVKPHNASKEGHCFVLISG